jgi:polar amino acid transport system substrate-binding protein
MAFHPDLEPMPPEILKRLAPTGILRAGINMSNFLLVSGGMTDGVPAGVSPDLARAIADHLDLGIRYVPYPSPGELADAAGHDEWDIGLIGAEPQRAEVISFTPAYAEIEATYLVPAGSPFMTVEDVDTSGARIAVTDRTAYGLWLDRNIRRAELVRSATFDDTLRDFRDQKLEALAGLRPRLSTDVVVLPGARMLDGRFMAVQQAVGTPKSKGVAIPYLTRFVDVARASGFVGDLIRKHGVQGLSIA